MKTSQGRGITGRRLWAGGGRSASAPWEELPSSCRRDDGELGNAPGGEKQAHSLHNKSHLKSHPIRRRAAAPSELSILRGISEGTGKDGSVANTQEAAIVPGKAFSSSRLNTFVLIETSDKSESESAAWTGGRTKTFSWMKNWRRERKRGLKSGGPAATQTNI